MIQLVHKAEPIPQYKDTHRGIVRPKIANSSSEYPQKRSIEMSPKSIRLKKYSSCDELDKKDKLLSRAEPSPSKNEGLAICTEVVYNFCAYSRYYRHF